MIEPRIVEEMRRIVDKYVTEPDLNELLKTFIQDKAAEGSQWSNITRYTHYMLGGDSPRIDLAAAMTEIILLSFDIIDDLQDGDNKEKPWIVCSHAFTLNGILAFLFSFMTEVSVLQESNGQAPLLMEKLGAILSQSINGQQIDLNDSISSESDYLTMIEKKSGSLLRFACSMGYLLIPDLDQRTIHTMDQLANYIGMISQLDNDIRDVLRFDVKNDLLQKKRTLPVLFLLMEKDEHFPYIQQYYNGQLTYNEFVLRKRECIHYIEDSGCIEYCKIIQSLHTDQANQLFESLPGLSPWKEKFKGITFAKQIQEVG
ncbi:competence protein ComQ [Paenibacillus sp. 1_12]|uniref:polyprenyl synthetase family protein n=1 Tax=Paenibacillus sp. 1_12 TaxID=1566278 RepID=UPI0008E9E448|nr:polyprenyl synthetase family protein [Paenibacillus sp. 1_12]SFL35593.1 competence protein ComQ [Paenibacillus sp. 1_12]